MWSSLTIAVFAIGFVQLANADSCIQCSSENDNRCAEFPAHLTATDCANATEYGCFARIVNGHTIRGCLGNLSTPNECTNTDTCSACFNVNNGRGCNNQQFPEVRLACHQCFGTLNSTCATEQADQPAMCNIYLELNRCFIRRTNDTIRRGCMSNDSGRCDTREHCLICDGWGCNMNVHTDPAIPEAPSAAVSHVVSVLMLMAALLFVQIMH